MDETTLTATTLASRMTLFEIDEDLDTLMHGAEEDAEANNGEVSEQLTATIMEYFEAHLRKVDRIATYIRAQEAEAQIASHEIERLQARQKAAKNRADRTKIMLGYFMATREIQRLRGELNTITLQTNSTPSLVITDIGKVAEQYYNVQAELTLPEWTQILAQLPPGPLASRLTPGSSRRIRVELDQGRIRADLANGLEVDGANLAKGRHVRIR